MSSKDFFRGHKSAIKHHRSLYEKHQIKSLQQACVRWSTVRYNDTHTTMFYMISSDKWHTRRCFIHDTQWQMTHTTPFYSRHAVTNDTHKANARYAAPNDTQTQRCVMHRTQWQMTHTTLFYPQDSVTNDTHNAVLSTIRSDKWHTQRCLMHDTRWQMTHTTLY